MEITQPCAPLSADFSALKKGLTQFNESVTGDVIRETVSSFVKNDDGEIVGGILGEINWNWLHIQGLWIDESIRGEGWGSRLLTQLEHYALAMETTNIRLETTSFQALEFYLKSGNCVFGELPEMPQGHTSYFLKKQL